MSTQKTDPSMQTLGMFAKYWQPGKVKSRLARHIGNERAASVYRLFVQHLSKQMANVGDQRILAFAPADREASFRALAGDTWQLQPQAEGDLGERMQSFFEHALNEGESAILIGSDSPHLSAVYVKSAFAALATHEVVIGPAEDGGYVLIGMRKLVPEIFQGIAWSTEDVLSQTEAVLRKRQVSYKLLSPQFDVDEFDDLKRLVSISDTAIDSLQSAIVSTLEVD